MRIMAIDFGDARVGLAVSDELQMLTGDAWTLTEHNMERAADKIVAEAKARNVGQLVLGYPKNMDGSLGPRAEKSEELKALLEARCALPVALWDERRVPAVLALSKDFPKEQKMQKFLINYWKNVQEMTSREFSSRRR